MPQRLYGASVVFFALFSYINISGNGFALDDFGLLNPLVRDGEWVRLATSDYWAGFDGLRSGLYRPLTTILLAAEFQVWGESPTPYHVLSAILHAVNSLLVHLLVQRLGGPMVGGLAGILFAVHPIHTEAVAGLGGRADLLAALSVLGVLWLRGRGRILWAVLVFSGGLLAKEQAVVLPGLALALDWHGRTTGRLGRLPWKEYALYGLVVALWLALRWQVLGGFAVPDISGLDNPLVELAPSVRIANAGAIAWRYLGLLVVPYKLSADYSFAALPVYADFFSWALVASAALGMAILLVVRKFARAPGLRSLGALWMLIAFSLVANVAAPIGTIMAERLLYLPSVGFCLLVAALMEGVWGLGRRRLFVLACTVLVAVLLGRTCARNADWRDAETLFRAAIAAYPHSAKAHQGLGEAMMKRGDWLGALDEFGRAAAIYPQYAAAHYNSGLCYWWLRQYENAIAAYERAVAIRPGYARAWMNMGAAHHALGALAAAAAAYRQAVDTRPDFAPAWENLAHTYREMGDRDRAVAAYRAFLRLRPEHERRAEYEQWIGGT